MDNYRRNKIRFGAFIIAIIGLVLGMQSFAFAVAKSWTGSGLSTDWDTANNWNPAAVPTTSDDIIIDSTTYQPVIGSDTNFSVATVTIQHTKAWTAGTLTINTGQTLTTSGNITISTGGTLTASGTAVINIGGNWSNSGAFTSGTGTVTFNGGSTQTLTSTGTGISGDDTAKDFNDLIVSGSTLQIASGSELEVDGTLTVNSSKALDLNGQTLDLNGALDNKGTVLLEGSETIGLGTWETAEGLCKYYGDSVTLPSALTAYYDLEFDETVDGQTYTLPANIDVNNNLTLTDGTLDANAANYQITVGGSWQNPNNQTFENRSGAVVFDDATKTNTITGNTTFHDLTCTTAGKAITFTDGTTQVIESGGTLALTGTSGVGNLITLRGSSTAGWNITDSGSENVSYVDVAYSTAANGITASSSKDSGNNSGWNLINSYTVGSSSPQIAGTGFSNTVTAKDGASTPNSTNAPSNITVTMSSSSGTMDFYTDDTYATPKPNDQYTLSSGTSSFTYYAKDTVSGTATITATDSNGKTGTSSSITINAGSLTSPVVTPASLVPTALGNATITFTNPTAVASGGKIKITFPSGFTVASDTGTVNSGGFTLSSTSANDTTKVVTLVLSGAIAASSSCSVTVNNITNPSSTGATGTFTVATTTSGDTTIESGTASAVTIAYGSLTSTNVEPASLVAGTVGNVTVSFINTTAVASGGKIKVTFPSGFTISSGATTTASATTPSVNSTVSISGQIVTITLSAALSASSSCSITLSNIKNPTVSGSTGTYSIATTDSSDNTIDQDTSVTADTITAGSLSSASVTPASLVLNAVGNVTVAFTNANPIPSNGTIVITFPSGFTISSGSTTVASSSVIDGTLTVSSSGQALTITRSGGSELAASTACSLTLTRIKNPSSTGQTGYFEIKTTNSSGTTIDENTSVAKVTIVISGFTVSATTPQVAGSAFNVTITALDADNNTYASYADTVTLSRNFVSPTSGTKNLSTTSVSGSSFSSGVATVSESYSDCGTITITATDASGAAGVSSNIVFVPYDFTVAASASAQTVNKSFVLTVTARNAGSTTTPNYTGNAALSISYVSPSTSQSGSLSTTSLTSSHFSSGVATPSISYNKWGTVTITATDSTVSTRTGTSSNIRFNPKDFGIALSAIPASRAFYYTNETFFATITPRDYSGDTISNYAGTVGFSGSYLNLPSNYTFTSSDTAGHRFSGIYGTAEAETTLSCYDADYTTITGSKSLTLKAGKIKVIPVSVPVGTREIKVNILDSAGNVITSDDATTFTVTLLEKKANSSATSAQTITAATVTDGVGKFKLTDNEAEAVTVTPSSSPSLTAVAGDVTFGTVAGSGVNIQMWREIRSVAPPTEATPTRRIRRTTTQEIEE